ncbi:MAG: hypothetical protein IJE95_04940 [Methanocorpusculum sp.]|nr:hypothetical protein [Methanocorpusculum sp.]
MAEMKLNKNTFKILVGVMIAVMVILIGVLVVHFAAPGIIAGISELINGNELVPGDEEQGPWGYKVYSWTYNGEKYQTELYISKSAYKNSNNPIGGTKLSGYIIDDDEGTVSILAGNLKRLANQKGLSDRETVDFVVSFVQSLAYLPDKTSGHANSYPRTPTVTLAEQTGDSKDLSILAATVIDKMGYSAAVLSYSANNFGGIYVPAAAALAVPGDSNANGSVYTVSKNSVNKTLEVIWVADTAKLGYPDVAYFIEEPEIIEAPNFWNGKAFKESAGPSLPTAEVFGIPDLEYTPDISWNTWKKEMSEFYKGQWYDTNIKWNSSASWKFYEHTLNVNPTPTATPSKDGILPGSLWRLSYTVTPTVSGLVGVESIVTGESEGSGMGMMGTGMGNETVTIDFTGMTPYSAAEIAVYDMSSGEPVLLDTFGWQGENLADSSQTSPVYPPGKYAVGLYVRNANVDITVQCSDNLNEVTYEGGI